MITDTADSQSNLAELFHQKAQCREWLIAPHLYMLESGHGPLTGSSRKKEVRTSRRQGNHRRPVQLPRPEDIVYLIHNARDQFGSTITCSQTTDGALAPTPCVHPSALEMFVEGVAHHFNNLFMAVQGYVSLLLRELDPDHPGILHLHRIEKLVHSESILTNDLLRFLIGQPYRISNSARTRLLRQIGNIACSFGAVSSGRRVKMMDQAVSQPPEQMLRQLSGSIACILGQLLFEIQEQAVVFAPHVAANERAVQRLQKIKQLTQEGLRPVCQLLGYAGYTAMPNGHRVGRGGLIEVVQKALMCKKQRIHLYMDVDVDLPKIKLQHRQLVEILMEVVDNAAEAMSQGGDLYFEAVKLRPEEIDEPGWNVPANHFIRLTFRDSGRGLDPRFSRLIFEPFFTNKGRVGHRGLGLSNIYGMVNTLGGYIGVETLPGRGAVFHIYLPSENPDLSRKAGPEARNSFRSADPQVIDLGKRRRLQCSSDRML